jgi:hypothetical protein
MDKSELIEKLKKMRLPVIAEQYELQSASPEYSQLSFDERFSELIDMEYDSRVNHTIERSWSESVHHKYVQVWNQLIIIQTENSIARKWMNCLQTII